MLFNTYVKQLGVVMRFGVRCHQYTDDNQLGFYVTSELGMLEKVLDWYLDVVVGWM